jgi:hypothetical protein
LLGMCNGVILHVTYTDQGMHRPTSPLNRWPSTKTGQSIWQRAPQGALSRAWTYSPAARCSSLSFASRSSPVF